MALPDDPVFPLASGLLDCLCSLLPDTIRGAVCSCCVYPGGEVPMDYCCPCSLAGGETGEGQAWVVAGGQYRAGATFTAQADQEGPGGCASNGWAVELTLGTYRCASTLDEDGDAPDCTGLERDAQALLSDAQALRMAALCCLPGLLTDYGGGRFQIGRIDTISPQGGCMGVQLGVIVEFYDCCPGPHPVVQVFEPDLDAYLAEENR